MLCNAPSKKLCFSYCGENCNCEIGMAWLLSEDAKNRISEIERHILIGGPDVFFIKNKRPE